MQEFKCRAGDAGNVRVERVLIVDDDPSVRTMLKIILARENHMVVGLVGGGADAIRLAGSCAPSLMLLDLDMPWMEGLTTLRELRQHCPWLPVLVFSSHDSDIYAVRCARLGARGFLSKGESAALLPEMIRQMRNGLMLFPSQIAEGGIPLSTLSDRELVALRCLVRGGDANTIAAALLVSRGAVNLLRRRLLTKLGLSNDEELIRFGQHFKLS